MSARKMPDNKDGSASKKIQLDNQVEEKEALPPSVVGLLFPPSNEDPPSDEGKLIRSALSIHQYKQGFNDCFVYVIVTIILRIIERVIMEGNAMRQSMFAESVERVTAPLTFRFGVNVVEVSRLREELQPWGHLVNVLQKYIRKYYSSNGGVTFDIFYDFFEKLNELTDSYNAASYPAAKTKIITDFLGFPDAVCPIILQAQQGRFQAGNSLQLKLTQEQNSLNALAINPRVPAGYQSLIASTSSYLKSFIDMVGQPNLLESAGITQEGLNGRITNLVMMLECSDDAQTNLINFLNDIKKNINCLLKKKYQAHEMNNPVNDLEKGAVIPLLEEFCSNLAGRCIKLNLNYEIVSIADRDKLCSLKSLEDKLREIYRLKAGSSYGSQCSYQGSSQVSLVDTGDMQQVVAVDMTEFKQKEEGLKLIQACKSLASGYFLSISFLKSKIWYKKFSQIPYHSDNSGAMKGSVEGQYPIIICASSTNPPNFAKSTIIDELIAEDQKNGVVLSGHGVTGKGIRLRYDGIIEIIEILIENSHGPEWPACWVDIKAFGIFRVSALQNPGENTPFYSMNIASVTTCDRMFGGPNISATASMGNACQDRMGPIGTQCPEEDLSGRFFIKLNAFKVLTPEQQLMLDALVRETHEADQLLNSQLMSLLMRDERHVGGRSIRKTRRKKILYATRKLHARKQHKQRKTKMLLKNKRRTKTVKCKDKSKNAKK